MARSLIFGTLRGSRNSDCAEEALELACALREGMCVSTYAVTWTVL